MGKVTKLDELEIYTSSLSLSKEIYKLCGNPLLRREFSLCEQLKRASISISANIAEGFGRNTKKDFSQFLSIALGSSNEVIALLDIVIINFDIKEALDTKKSFSILCKRIYKFRKYITDWQPTSNN